MDETARPSASAPKSGLDFGRLLRFFFDDPQWVVKILVGGLFALLSMAVIGSLFVAGYMVGIIRRTLREETPPLPEWNDFGQLLTDGLKAFAVYLIYGLPLLILLALMGLAVGGAAAMVPHDRPDAFQMMAVLAVFAGWVLFVLASFALVAYLPAALVRFVANDRIAAALEVRENLSFIRRNLANYSVALLAFLTASFIAQFAIVLFCVGIFPASFWSSAVLAYALGEVARNDPGSPAAPWNETTDRRGTDTSADFLP